MKENEEGEKQDIFELDDEFEFDCEFNEFDDCEEDEMKVQ